jgi:hypothetical protein
MRNTLSLILAIHCRFAAQMATIVQLLEPIGNVPPAEFESMYYHQLEESAVAA